MAIARSVNHVSFPVRDLAAALGFYRDLLGLETIPRPDFGIDGVLSLVRVSWEGTTPDGGALTVIQATSSRDPAPISRTVRRWHRTPVGRYGSPITMSTRSTPRWTMSRR